MSNDYELYIRCPWGISKKNEKAFTTTWGAN